MQYTDLLNSLTICPGPDDLGLRTDPQGLKYVSAGLPEFIGPDIVDSVAVENPNDPQVIVISAAGAAGKSTLGRQIAFEKQAPLWDLAMAPMVAGRALQGELLSAFGVARIGETLGKLFTGKLFVVIDALDEALIKVGSSAFEDFMKDTAAQAAQANGVAFILLGRTQTAETAWLMLTEAGVRVSLLSIQPFTRAQAEQYIDARVQHYDQASAERRERHRVPFVQARDAIFTQLELAIQANERDGDRRTREFLGYAPVLETIAVLLARETNYSQLLGALTGSQFADTSNAGSPLSVLLHVVEHLLAREKEQKLDKSIGPDLRQAAIAENWDDWDVLYRPEEQRARLLGRILNIELNPSPDSLPPKVRAAYEEQLAEWVPEHPFLRGGRSPANAVFESYLFADAMRQYLTPLSLRVEERVSHPEYRPSRLLADFYMSSLFDGQSITVAARQVGLLYDSFLAGETDAMRVRLSLDLGDDDTPTDGTGDNEGEFELVYAITCAAGDEEVDKKLFHIDATQGRVHFLRRLKDATIVTSEPLSLGQADADFEMGPAVDITCGGLAILSPKLVIVAGAVGRDTEGVVLEAKALESSLVAPPLVRGELHVCWPDSRAYPWTQFSFETDDHRDSNPHMHEVLRRFRRIVTTLQSHSKGSLARFRDKVEHRRVIRNRVGQALLQKLLDDGVMVLRQNFYHWVPARADELFQVNWHDVRYRRESPSLRAYLLKFVEDNPDLFAD